MDKIPHLHLISVNHRIKDIHSLRSLMLSIMTQRLSIRCWDVARTCSASLEKWLL